jgi:hypothetical protein
LYSPTGSCERRERQRSNIYDIPFSAFLFPLSEQNGVFFAFSYFNSLTYLLHLHTMQRQDHKPLRRSFAMSPVDPYGELRPAKNVDVAAIQGGSAAVRAGVDDLRKLVLSISPECLVMRRKERDKGWIFVPPERQYESKNKNLLTIKATPNQINFAIWPAKLVYDPAKLPEYRGMMQALFDKMLRLNNSSVRV